ncbi:unnamed protein product, partial [Ectocarpus fasciculatus]
VAWFGCRHGAAVRRGGNSNNSNKVRGSIACIDLLSGAPEHKQWHSNVGLDDFVGHVLKFNSLVDSTQTRELGTVDKEQLKKMMGWGLFIEQVVGGLDTDSQRNSLAQALGLSHCAILPRLYQARRWVLRSMLGSTFLADHPRPESLLMWIMACNEELPPLQAHEDAGDETHQAASFANDASAVVKSRGDVGVVSHAYSALLLCGGGNKLGSSSSTREAAGDGGKSTRVPCLYEMSVETAQKRAYANNCFMFLSSRCARDDGQHKHGVLAEQVTSFILELSELARTDIVSLEILCLVLLEPWRQASCIATHQAQDSARGSQQESLDTSLNSAILKQASGFQDDARLWSLDEWLLGEMSHRYESFARAYVEKLTRSREELVRRDYLTSADSSGRCLRKEDVQSRLHVLCSRSERLKRLVFRTIALK